MSVKTDLNELIEMRDKVEKEFVNEIHAKLKETETTLLDTEEAIVVFCAHVCANISLLNGLKAVL